MAMRSLKKKKPIFLGSRRFTVANDTTAVVVEVALTTGPPPAASSPHYGISVGDDSKSDSEFVKKMMKSPWRQQPEKYDPSKYYFGKPASRRPDFRAIQKALDSFSGKEDEPNGSAEYIRQRLSRRISCPLCNVYDSWNYYVLLEHINNHPEVTRYEKFWRHARQEYQTLRDRRGLLKEQINMLSNMGMNREARAIRRFSTSMAQRLYKERLCAR
jgi:hypothetical protein